MAMVTRAVDVYQLCYRNRIQGSQASVLSVTLALHCTFTGLWRIFALVRRRNGHLADKRKDTARTRLWEPR